jgi:predicted ABC-type ATPase
VPELVVITGPIASGKSAVARSLAEIISEAGRSAVVADLDDIVGSIWAPAKDVAQTWEVARMVHGRLIGEWLSLGVDVVIADGPFYSKIETASLMHRVPSTTLVRRMLLLTTYEVALERVARDPSRGISKDPVILRSKYDEFERQLPNIDLCEWTFDTAITGLADIVATVSRGLLPT